MAEFTSARCDLHHILRGHTKCGPFFRGRSHLGRRETAGRIPPGLLVQYIASTFIPALNWRVESRSPLRAKEVDDLFRTLIRPTLAVIEI